MYNMVMSVLVSTFIRSEIIGVRKINVHKIVLVVGEILQC